MDNKKENVPNQHLANIFKKEVVSENLSNPNDSNFEEQTLVPKSIGGIELKNYKEGEYKGLEEYENE